MTDRLIWIWLSLACGPGSRAYNLLFASFNTLREIYDAPKERFLEINGIDKKTAEALADKDISRAKSILEMCIKCHWGVLTYGDRAYPKRLKTLVDPPVVLYYKGRFLDLNDQVCIAVVGTRTMSDYGEREAYKLSYAMAAGGAVIVSGMALGCDAMAANGALDAAAPTVAVLGCGIDMVYPPQHRMLSEHIAATGMIITEYPPGEKPEGAHFPVRNRIISGLSQGTVVIEAPLGSGALITANTALYQGRDIYAVPGELGNKNSEGTNALIRGGANVVTSAVDVLGNYEFIYPHRIFVISAQRAEKTLSTEKGHSTALLRQISSRKPKSAEEHKKLKTEKKAEREERVETVREYKKDLKSVKKEKALKSGKIEPSKNEEKSYSFIEERVELGDTVPKKESKPTAKSDVPITDSERAVLDAMGDSAITPDELMAKGFSAADIMSALTILEILGYVTSVPGGRYVKN